MQKIFMCGHFFASFCESFSWYLLVGPHGSFQIILFFLGLIFCHFLWIILFWYLSIGPHGSFRLILFFFLLNLLPFGLFLFFFLVWPLLSLVEHMNNLWVTIIKIACTIWLIMVTYERHEQSYLSQNGFRQFPVSSQNIWQLQYNYWTTG